MEWFKFEYFARDYPGVPFPSHATMLNRPAAFLRRRVQKAFNVSVQGESLEVARLFDCEQPAFTLYAQALRRRLEQLPRIALQTQPDLDSFRPGASLAACGIPKPSRVYAAWGPDMHPIDDFEFEAFDRHVEDIWYPSSDDLVVFDETLAWLLWIHHEGSAGLTMRPT